MLHERGIPFHVDCVQVLGKEPVNLRELRASTASFSAHKIHGPKGIGALFVRNSMRLSPFLVGGHQERERRAGTEAVSSIAGFGVAVTIAQAECNTARERLRGLRDLLWAEIDARIPGVALNGDPAPDKRLASTLNISFSDTEGETVLIGLDLEGIAASSGSACTAGSLEPSHVLVAMGVSPERARAALRISMHRETTEEQVRILVTALEKVVATVREAAPSAVRSGGARYG
jgi:cysteine desulfurase